MSKNKTFNFLFFSLQICCHFQFENNSPGFFLQNGRQSRRSQNDMLPFLEKIQYKTNLTLPSDTNIVYRYVLSVDSIIFAGQPLFTNFILLQSDDRDGILLSNWVWRTSSCHFNNRMFDLALWGNLRHCV